VYIGTEAVRVQRGTLPGGDAGTVRTLGMMRELVRQGARSLAVRNTAIDVIRSAGVRAHDTLGEVRALYTWVRDRVRFVGDPVGVELLQGAPYTLQSRSGDCDDYAILLGSMLQSIGVPVDVRFKVIGANPSRPRSFSHVYLTVKDQRGRVIPLDPIYDTTPFGSEYRNPFRTMEAPA
jgi:transglutaminase-like putative cysteine protease